MIVYKLFSIFIFFSSFLVTYLLLAAPVSPVQPRISQDQPKPISQSGPQSVDPISSPPAGQPAIRPTPTSGGPCANCDRGVGQPAIRLTPTSGGPGTIVNIIGNGFPAGQTIRFYLGVSQVSLDQEPLDLTEVAEDGILSGDFPLPLTWPDGRPLTEPELLVMVANDDFGVKATASFRLMNAQPDTQPYLNGETAYSVALPPSKTIGEAQ